MTPNPCRRREPTIPKASSAKASPPRSAPPIRVPKKPTPPERIPKVIANPTLDDHLAVISRAVFQAGLSWALIDVHWDEYVTAFDGFSVTTVAAYEEAAIERLMLASGIVHSRSKIEGTIRNARTLIALAAEFGSIAAYQASFDDYDAARKDAQKRFAFLGDLSTYYWRFRTGAAVPDLETWMAAQDRDHPRMREMVLAAQRSAI
jgi:3-methyladenine DNA glycosylase Tag